MVKKSKKKNTITIIALLLLIVAMGAAYFLLADKEDSEGDSGESENTGIELSAIDTDQVSSIIFDNGTLEMTLLYDGENWTNEADSEFPVYAIKANAMLEAIAGLSAVQKVTDAPEDISEFGLDNPLLTAKIQLKDGTAFALKIGSKLVTDDGYYAMVEGDPAVYVVAKSVYNMFNINQGALIEMKETPSLEITQLRGLKVESKEFGNFETECDLENEYDFSGNGMYQWTIYQPYDLPVNSSAASMETLFGNYTSFTMKECVEYNAKDMSVYGLDDPTAVMTIKYAQTAEIIEGEEVYTYTLHFGDLDAEGNYYYVREEGSNSVYTMSKSSAEDKLNIDPLIQVFPLPGIVYINTCDQIDIVMGEEEYQIVIEHIPSEDEEEEETQIFYFEGVEAVNEDNFRTFYQELIGYSIVTELSRDWSDKGVKPVMSFVFHKNTKEHPKVTIEFLPYNDNFYAVRVNGDAIFGADIRDIKALQELIRNFDPTAGKAK